MKVNLSTGQHFWNRPVTLPDGFHLKITGVRFQHQYLNANHQSFSSILSPKANNRIQVSRFEINDDDIRCGDATIKMSGSRLTYPSREPGEEYYGYREYWRLRAGSHCNVKFRGLTIKADVEEYVADTYVTGFFLVSGEFANMNVTDARVELGRAVFIHANSWGEKTIAFGHVRFAVSANGADGKQFAISTATGASWDGRQVSYSIMDVDFGRVEKLMEPSASNLKCLTAQLI